MIECLGYRAIRFNLRMDECVQLIDSAPNPVLLSMITDQNETRHLTYYAPVGSNNWTSATTGDLSLNNISIYSPGPWDKNTFIDIDVDDDIETFLLVWTQYHYIPNGEHWTLRIGNNAYYEQELHCYSNGNPSGNNNWISMRGGNGSSPRAVSLCFKKKDFNDAPCPNFTIPINPASPSSDVPHDSITCISSETTTSTNDVTSSSNAVITSLTGLTSFSGGTSTSTSSSTLSTPTISPIPTSTLISSSPSTISPTPTSTSTSSPCTPIDDVWPETQAGVIARGTCERGIFNGMSYNNYTQYFIYLY